MWLAAGELLLEHLKWGSTSITHWTLNSKMSINTELTKEEMVINYSSNSKSRPLTSVSRHNESCVFSTHNRVRTDCHIFHHYSVICMFVCTTKADQRQLVARRSIVKTWHSWNVRKSIWSNIPCYTILYNDSKNDHRVGQPYGGTLDLHQMIQDI